VDQPFKVSVADDQRVGDTKQSVNPLEHMQEPRTRSSRLAAWEQEIEQLSHQSKEVPLNLNSEQQIAQAAIERDQHSRDLQLRDRLRNERSELEHEKHLRVAAEVANQQVAQPSESTLNNSELLNERAAHATSLREQLRIDGADQTHHEASEDHPVDDESVTSNDDSVVESDQASQLFGLTNRARRRRNKHGGR
jgi:hypothetical protein